MAVTHPPLREADRPDMMLASSYFLRFDRKGERIEGPFAPLGPLYIAAMLRLHHLRPGWFDGAFARGLDDFARALKSERPRSVGIYATVISRHVALGMGAVAHRLGVPAIAGGPDPSSAPDLYLRTGDFAAVAKGGGEETAVELAKHFRGDGPPLHRILGIHFSEGGADIFTGERPYIMDLDTVPYPAKDLIDWGSYSALTRRLHGTSQTTVMTARGCPFR